MNKRVFFTESRWVKKLLSQESIASYVKRKDFKVIADEFEAFIKDVHGHTDIKSLFDKSVVFEGFDSKHKMHIHFAPFIAMWSPHFLTCLYNTKLKMDDQPWSFRKISFYNRLGFRTPNNLLKSRNHVDRIVSEAFILCSREICRYHDLEWTALKMAKSDWWSNTDIVSLMNKHTDYLETVVNHFKNIVFKEVKQYTNRSAFMDLFNATDKDFEKFAAFDLQFYDENTSSVVETKFVKINWSISWVWEALLHLYLMRRDFKFEGKGITIYNTLRGIKYTVSLEKLLGANNIEKFYRLCKKLTIDEDKIHFRNVCAQALKGGFELFKIDREQAYERLEKLHYTKTDVFYKFLKHVMLQDNRQEILCDPMILWNQFVEFDAEEAFLFF